MSTLGIIVYLLYALNCRSKRLSCSDWLKLTLYHAKIASHEEIIEGALNFKMAANNCPSQAEFFTEQLPQPSLILY